MVVRIQGIIWGKETSFRRCEDFEVSPQFQDPGGEVAPTGALGSATAPRGGYLNIVPLPGPRVFRSNIAHLTKTRGSVDGPR